MCDIARHRGPDDAGYVFFEGEALDPEILSAADTPPAVSRCGARYSPSRSIDPSAQSGAQLVLGHRRLSIIDLSALGHQPMCSSDGRFWITYNGEIYNHLELRAELEGRGHRFISRSDTEVILAAYAEWGAQCLERLNGMWALAIVDRQRRELFLARDRYGIKPLYYWRSTAGLLAFGSEIKQFTVLPGWKARVNGQRAYDFLAWFPTDHTEETLFERVYQLPPGTCATLALDGMEETARADGRIEWVRWYTLAAEQFAGTFEEAGAELRRRLSDAVRLQLRSDVPLGFALSGGVDSSSVTCLASGILRESGAAGLRTFSMCAEGESFNERPWIDAVVAAAQASPTYVTPSGDGLLDALPAMTWQQDEPFGSPAVFGQWSVFRAASEAAVKVILGGHGSDEPLAGYPPFYAPMFNSLARRGKWLDLAQEALALRALYGYSLLFAPRLLLHAAFPSAIESLKGLLGRDTGRPPWLDLSRLGAVARDPFAAVRLRGERSLPELSRTLLLLSPSPMVLHYEDRNSMAHSFESRVPFLDHRVVEFALGLPDEFKLHRGIHKRVLREAMRSTLPEAVQRRTDKVGMGTPNLKWIADHASRAKFEEAVDVCNGALTRATGAYVDAVLSGARQYDQALWRILSFADWIKTFRVAI
jgi:asparagine synthase (glutamine-hydrolysing)